MRLKEVRPVLAGIVVLYEEAEKENEYDDVFIGICSDIPEVMLEREIIVIGASLRGEMLDIELKKK